MPKKYSVEMRLVDDASGSMVASDTDEEWYETESDARKGFQDKVKAAKEKGKGSS
jgi:hypothetical protein